jgi:hypothetical protein
MARPTVKDLLTKVADLERDVAALKSPPAEPAPKGNASAAAAPAESTPRHVPKENAEPGVPAAIISEKDIKQLHKVYDETEDPAIGRLLDQVCANPACAAHDDD